MRRFLLLLLFAKILIYSDVFGQDYIKLLSGEVFYGNIKEVTPSEIYYRSIIPNDTILYSIDKQYVSFVKYQKKIKEMMNEEKVDSRKVIPYKHKYPITSIDGGDYLIEGRRAEVQILRAILLDKNDPELTKLVKKFTAEKRIGTIILYGTIPIAVTSLMLFFYNHAVGFGSGNPTLDHAIYALLGGEAALFSGNIYLRFKKVKHIREAIARYNTLIQ